jgi:hypothetical protein
VSCLDWKRGTPNAKCARRTTHALFSPFLFQFVCARPVSDWAINMLATALGSGPKSFFNASVTISGPPPPPAKVGTTATGTCGVTLVCEKPDCCNTQAKGSWAAAAANISTLAECVAKAKPCSQAAFVSFSQPQNDCSWYKACDMGHLLHPATWHGESEVIREVSPTPATPDVFALPWIRHDVGDDSLHKRGVLLVNKAEMPTVVELKAIGGQEGQGQFRTWPTNRTSVLVLDGTVDGFTVVRTTTLVPWMAAQGLSWAIRRKHCKSPACSLLYAGSGARFCTAGRANARRWEVGARTFRRGDRTRLLLHVATH